MDTETEITYETVAEAHGLPADVFTLYCENQHIDAEDCEDAVSAYADDYVGYFDTIDDFAMSMYEECIDELPSAIFNAINWELVWGMTLSHDYYDLDGHIFRN